MYISRRDYRDECGESRVNDEIICLSTEKYHDLLCLCAYLSALLLDEDSLHAASDVFAYCVVESLPSIITQNIIH